MKFESCDKMAPSEMCDNNTGDCDQGGNGTDEGMGCFVLDE